MSQNHAANASEPPRKPPAHERVYLEIRDQILFGDMAPGQPVTIQGLADSLGAGITPVREALRRLISDGALQFQDNRRVCVPSLTAADLSEIAFLRKTTEIELTRRATDRADKLAIEALAAIDLDLDRAIEQGDVKGYLTLNYRFHAALYDMAEAPILAGLALRLWLRFGPSLRVVCGRIGTRNLPDQHKALLEALRAQDVEAAIAAMAADVEEGLDHVRQTLPQDAP